MALVNLSIYYARKNIKSEYNNNKFKISAPTWNNTSNLSLKNAKLIYLNRIKNRNVFKIKTGYKLELLTPETIKLLGSTKKYVDKEKDGKNAPKLEPAEVVSVV